MGGILTDWFRAAFDRKI